MSDDPMLAKAERIERELLRESVQLNDGDMTIATHAERLLERAALLIQQMRMRIAGNAAVELEEG